METHADDPRSQASDGDLVRSVRAGAKDAFDVLVRRYRGLVVGRAYARLRDRGEAEDAAQEALLAAFRSLGQLRRPEAFGPWLRKIAGSVTRRAASRLARRPGRLRDAEAVAAPARAAEVFEAVAALSEEDQQVLHLHYSQGYTCAEIAGMLSLRVGSVTSRLTRARRRLRELLDEEAR